MSRKKTDNKTLNLFHPDNIFSNQGEETNCFNCNIVYLSDFINKRKELDKLSDRNSILHSFFNHAKQFDW